MISMIEPGWWKGDDILIQDKGNFSKGAKTRLYEATRRGEIIGHVKWSIPARKYVFFTNYVVLEDPDLLDLGNFIKERNEERKSRWHKKTVVDWELVNSWREVEDQVTQV